MVVSRLNFGLKIPILYFAYEASTLEENRDRVDYKIAIILGIMSLAGTFLITHGAMLNLQASQIMHSTYEKGRESERTTCSHFMNFMSLTFFGLLGTVLPFQLLYIGRLTFLVLAWVLLSICISFLKYNNKHLSEIAADYVNDFFDSLIKRCASLNDYQVNSLQFATSIVQLTYEDMLWILLLLLVRFEVLDVGELTDGQSKGALLYSLILSIFSFVSSVSRVALVANGLEEDWIVFIMSRVTANSTWLPYQLTIERQELEKCVDFSQINAPLPLNLSHATGYFQSVEFVFTDHTIKSFVSDVNSWVKDAGEKNDQLILLKQHKRRFVMDIKTLSGVSQQTMKDAIESFPFEYFSIEMSMPTND